MTRRRAEQAFFMENRGYPQCSCIFVKFCMISYFFIIFICPAMVDYFFNSYCGKLVTVIFAEVVCYTLTYHLKSLQICC